LTGTGFLPPGATEAIEYNLARRLLPVYATVDPATADEVREMARTTLATYKRANLKLVDIPTDPALVQQPAGGYNIVTGGGGGGGTGG
jgi:hypothetical protein